MSNGNIFKPIVVTDYNEFMTKGVQIELDQAAAESLGVIEEFALSEADAWDSQNDPSDFDFVELDGNVIHFSPKTKAQKEQPNGD